MPPTASDYIPMQEFEDIKFVNVDNRAMAYFYDPPQAWANIKDCGDFPCTAPKNTLYSFKRVKFEGPNLPDIASEGVDTF